MQCDWCQSFRVIEEFINILKKIYIYTARILSYFFYIFNISIYPIFSSAYECIHTFIE